MTPSDAGTTKRHQRTARQCYKQALAAYQQWDLDTAIAELEEAVALSPNNATYYIALAQALARAGRFDQALRALANYLRLKPNSSVSTRIEQLFASGTDPVENQITAKMTEAQLPIHLVGAAIQMWLEFRIALGEDPLHIPKPEAWAAALDYTARKVNLREIPLGELAAYYGVSPGTVRKHHRALVEKLDIMPCDYRYFTEEINPLDKLVEAAELLEQLEARFNQE